MATPFYVLVLQRFVVRLICLLPSQYKNRH